MSPSTRLLAPHAAVRASTNRGARASSAARRQKWCGIGGGGGALFPARSRTMRSRAKSGDGGRDGVGMDDDWLTRMIDDARARERAEAEAHDAKGGNGAADGYSARFEEEEEDDDDDDAFEYEPNAYAGGDLTESEEGDMLGTSPPCAGSTGGVGEEDGGVFADACGSPAVVLVGFRAEEWPRVRTLVDELGGYDVPVIPARSEHAWMTLEEVTREREPDWESPRTSNASAARGGEYGSQRMVAFSGLDLGEVAVVVSAIESQGLPRLPVIIASEENLQKPLGESLALAIRAHRRDARRRRRRGSTVHDDDDDKNEVKDDTTSREAETVVVPEVLTTTPSALDARAESERRAAAARASAVAAVSEPSHARDETGDNNDNNDDDDTDATKTTNETSSSSSSSSKHPPSSTGFVTKSQLRELAHRRGLDYDVLIADARAKGVVLPE